MVLLTLCTMHIFNFLIQLIFQSTYTKVKYQENEPKESIVKESIYCKKCKDKKSASNKLFFVRGNESFRSQYALETSKMKD